MEKKFYFSTKALIINDHKFLALFNVIDHKKKWDLPGGRMEFGETAEETLKREIFEELSVDIKPIKLIDTWNYVYQENFQITGIIYHCSIMGEDISLSHEHDGYEWIDINHISERFTSKVFLERMHAWNWDAIIEGNSNLIEHIEEVEISSLIPNNLFLNIDKIHKVKAAYHKDSVKLLPPVIVARIDDELSLIDGHSRAWVAYKNGKNYINAIIKPIDQIGGSEELYRKIHDMAKLNKILDISCLEDKILNPQEYEKQWIGLCNKLMKELEYG